VYLSTETTTSKIEREMSFFLKTTPLLFTLVNNNVAAFHSQNFLSKPFLRNYSGGTHLNFGDVSEWRDIMFEPPNGISNLDGEDDSEGPLREVNILPFPLDDALLQGETKELCLYEERFHDLFEKSRNDHAGVVAMGLMAPPSGILQNMPLCEIESFQKMEGNTGFGKFSILATIRVVGRAKLVYIDETDDIQKEFLTGWCFEAGDDTSNSNQLNKNGKDMIQIGNDVADKLESVFNSIVLLEEQLSQEEGGMDSDTDDAPSEATLRRMKLEAELELEGSIGDYDDDDDDDDHDDDDGDSLRNKFQRAYQTAKSSDTQGYRITSASGNESGKKLRSVQDLTALSWAYLSQELWNLDEIMDYRLRALEVEDLNSRLKVALVMMMEQRSKLREALRSRDE
jgi:hypothetical protein